MFVAQLLKESTGQQQISQHNWCGQELPLLQVSPPQRIMVSGKHTLLLRQITPPNWLLITLRWRPMMTDSLPLLPLKLTGNMPEANGWPTPGKSTDGLCLLQFLTLINLLQSRLRLMLREFGKLLRLPTLMQAPIWLVLNFKSEPPLLWNLVSP